MDRLAAMETFIRVVETGSFSVAARGLGLGQPAVSKAVAQLEEHLGSRLLMRSTHGLKPTEAGRLFYERAKRTIVEFDGANLAAREANSGLTGRLRICAPVTFARLHIVPHLHNFLASHPKLTIDMVLDDRVIDLVKEGIDIALRIGTLGKSTLTARKLASATRVVVGASSYLDRRGAPRTPAELSEHDAVVYAQAGGGETWTFCKADTEVSVSVSGRLRFTAAEGVRAAVLAGAGLAIGSEWMFAPELASGEVRRVLGEWSLPSVDLWAIYPAGRMSSAKIRAFTSFVEAELRTG